MKAICAILVFIVEVTIVVSRCPNTDQDFIDKHVCRTGFGRPRYRGGPKDRYDCASVALPDATPAEIEAKDAAMLRDAMIKSKRRNLGRTMKSGVNTVFMVQNYGAWVRSFAARNLENGQYICRTNMGVPTFYCSRLGLYVNGHWEENIATDFDPATPARPYAVPIAWLMGGPPICVRERIGPHRGQIVNNANGFASCKAPHAEANGHLFTKPNEIDPAGSDGLTCT